MDPMAPTSAPLARPPAGSALRPPDRPHDPPDWTCPFCPLLCDGLPRPHVQRSADGAATPGTSAGTSIATWAGIDCTRATAALALQPVDVDHVSANPLVDGCAVGLESALDQAAALLRSARQPLAAGLATDVAGARAMYRLQAACGAISDVAGGASVMAALRALQDRGGFSTTLAELRSRADCVLVLGRPPVDSAPRLFVRPAGALEAPDALAPDAEGPDAAVLDATAPDGDTSQDDPPIAPLPPHRGALLACASGDAARCAALPGAPCLDEVEPGGDLPALLAELTVWVGGRRPAVVRPALQALAERLRAARYAVLVLESKPWGEAAGLVVEAANRLVAALNVRGRAALLSLGGGDGAATVNQVQTWLSGLPVRSRAGADGLAHEPLAWDTGRLLAPPDGGPAAVDALLWVSSFGVQPALPALPDDLPLIALQVPGAPVPDPATRRAPTIVIPVASPGIGQGGHLVRTDGSVMLPLQALRADGLPTVAAVADALLARLRPQWLPAATTEVRHG
ncbi:MAG: hypothetical protein RL223_201 [Pseudomonadota bacterium]